MKAVATSFIALAAIDASTMAIVASLAVLTGFTPSARAAEENANPPNFAPSAEVGWIASSAFSPPVSGPGPVRALSGVSNVVAAATGAQPTFPIVDADSPILLPWAREVLRKKNERILSGKSGFSPQASCLPNGVPGFVLHAVVPTYIIQSPREVVMISEEDIETRHIYLNVAHSAHVVPSWHGDSVGHYDGDALVVDTIGMNIRTWVDNLGTPHTDQLHVIENFHLIDGGKTLEVNVHVEDPGAFTTPWNAIQRFRRVEQGPMVEMSCAENNANYFNHDVAPKPHAETPDF